MTSTFCFPKASGLENCAIKHAAVIGAGAMGAGIAAQFANAGIAVELLDIAGAEATDRNAPAQAGLERQIKIGGFMHADAAQLVRVGNIDEHMNRLGEADWIIEVVTEQLEIKRSLYRRIEKVRKNNAIVSSNTSTIPRADLIRDVSEEFAAHFLITHFFNPPRVMRLVEIVRAAENTDIVVDTIANACDAILGKTVVNCRDTPGFIANRIGCFWIAVGIIEAKKIGLTMEEADAVMAALGIPKTGVFGLMDLIGLDLVPDVWGSLMSLLPKDDAIHKYNLTDDATVSALIADGRLGRKTKAGFYRMNSAKQLEALDFETTEYRPTQPFNIKSLAGAGRDTNELVNSEGKYGQYARNVLTAVIAYAAENAPEIADDFSAIDTAIKLGYAWKYGPFHLADKIGVKKISAWLASAGQAVPNLLNIACENGGFFDSSDRPLGTNGKRILDDGLQKSLVNFTAIKASETRLAGNDAASLWDLGGGIACFEIHTKMNALTTEVFDALEATISKGGVDFQALVIATDDPRIFSAGANLPAIVEFISTEKFDELDSYISRGQKLLQQLKFSDFPVVAAMHGLALGGGCELALHANRIVAHAELNVGLPEILVGLVPGWGGCAQLLMRAQASTDSAKGPVAIARQVFEVIASGQKSSSALAARASGFLVNSDIVVMNRDNLLQTAKQCAADMLADGFKSPDKIQLSLSGLSGKKAIMSNIHAARAAGRITDTDVTLADALANVLTGGADADPMSPVGEAEIMELERNTLGLLAEMPTTKARIEHMLKVGKPLKN